MFMIDLSMPSHYSNLGISPDVDGSEIRASLNHRYGDLERQRLKARNPDEKRQLAEQQKMLNRIGDLLSNPTERKKYDQENAHLTFFLIQEAGAEPLVNKAARVEWLHGVLHSFLARRGESVSPVTDLERTDFTADFTENERLDTLLVEGLELESEG